jgi:hypothetical protein
MLLLISFSIPASGLVRFHRGAGCGVLEATVLNKASLDVVPSVCSAIRTKFRLAHSNTSALHSPSFAQLAELYVGRIDGMTWSWA